MKAQNFLEQEEEVVTASPRRLLHTAQKHSSYVWKRSRFTGLLAHRKSSSSILATYQEPCSIGGNYFRRQDRALVLATFLLTRIGSIVDSQYANVRV
jgi:hypothetical protein